MVLNPEINKEALINNSLLAIIIMVSARIQRRLSPKIKAYLSIIYHQKANILLL